MRLFEAIVDANHRALAGDAAAGLRPADFASELPVVALTCIDARLNPLFPEVLGVPKEQFIWLRNAGNIITGPLSSTMRSLALACAIKGGKEIVIIGHNDCLVGKTTTTKLTDAFRALGVDRAGLPDNLTEFFGMFASERQNVMKGVEFTRRSPLIGPKVPVHGLMVDITTGKLEWIVNGYQALDLIASGTMPETKFVEQSADALRSLAAFKIGEMKFPDTKIGEIATQARDWLTKEIQPVTPTQAEVFTPSVVPPVPPMAQPPSSLPPRVPPVVAPPPGQQGHKKPLPPRVKPSFNFPKGRE